MKKKILKKAMALSISAVAAATVLGAVGCGGDNNDGNGNNSVYYDNGKDAIVFSSQAFDGVFNPFYNTSAMDSNAVSLTQLSMIGNNKDGEPVWGKEEAVIVESLQTVTSGTPNVDQKTEYYFVLKNNVKFSNGSPLTIRDVLFNMYVYLDPAYTGSSTMYSTDIVGLQEYRTQAASEKEQDAFEEQFTVAASARIMSLTSALQNIKRAHPSEITMSNDKMKGYLEAYKSTGSAYANIVNDYNRAEKLFKQELQNDFNNSKDSYQDTTFKDSNGKIYKNLFTTDVEVFLYNEGLIKWNKKDGKLESDITNDLNEIKGWSEEKALGEVFAANVPLKMDEVINYWATSTELAVAIAGDARDAYFKTHTQTYKNVRGIEFINRTSSVKVRDDKSGEEKTYAAPTYNDDKSVKEGNEVLKVTINGIDPKAIWNFAFGVAPMYYYSTPEQVSAFDYTEHFGVAYGSPDFQESAIKNPDKIGVPVGAGPYMAASASGKTDGIESGDFLANNIMYFRSNPNYLMGEPLIKNLHYQVVSSNQIMNSLQTGEIDFGEPSAKTETINQLKGLANKGLKYSNIQTAGYGYVGVNAARVPSIYVRRAIMHCIDTSLAVKYYDGTAEAIYRPISRSSWAYPKGALPYYPYIGAAIPDELDKIYPDYANYVQSLGLKSGDKMSEQQQIDYVKYLVEEKAGYSLGSDGLYRNGNNVLKYTFAIAGQENDHPSFSAMYQAGQFLTDKVKGFQIITKPDNQALVKLATGSLAVWAAAWGSTIDPDMYQVYHMDSKATSVLNWGYNAIKTNAGGRYDTEYDLITRLSEKIEKGRETNVLASRAIIYKDALDLVMELAVELPMYQRDDLFAYNSYKIDVSTFTPENERSAFNGLVSDVYKLSLVTNKEK